LFGRKTLGRIELVLVVVSLILIGSSFIESVVSFFTRDFYAIIYYLAVGVELFYIAILFLSGLYDLKSG